MRKSGKRPTRKQKILLEGKHLDPENWLIRKATSNSLEIINRKTGNARTIYKAGVSL